MVGISKYLVLSSRHLPERLSQGHSKARSLTNEHRSNTTPTAVSPFNGIQEEEEEAPRDERHRGRRIGAGDHTFAAG